MKFSRFGDKFARECGILQLMDDLGHALAEGGADTIMLGGGNPSHIPQVEACLRERMARMLRQAGDFEAYCADAQSPVRRSQASA